MAHPWNHSELIRSKSATGYRFFSQWTMESGPTPQFLRRLIRGIRIMAQPVQTLPLARRIAAICIFVLALVVMSGSAASAEGQSSPARKLGRGMANLSLGVMAIPSEVIATTRRSGPAIGATWGFVRGAGFMIATEAVGLWEVLTCPFATPPDYQAIIQPEFPWQRFSDQPDRDAERRVRTANSTVR